MVETVETVTLNKSPILRSNAQSNTRTVLSAKNTDKNQQAAEELRVVDKVEIPYISPFVHVDVNYDKAVLQLRDSSSGEVLEQFPSKKVLEERRIERVRTEAELSQPVKAPEPETTTVSDSQAQLIEAQAETTVRQQQQVARNVGASAGYKAPEPSPVEVDTAQVTVQTTETLV